MQCTPNSRRDPREACDSRGVALAAAMSWVCAAAIFGWLLLFGGGCDAARTSEEPGLAPPRLSLVQQGDTRVELRVEGPTGLRALQVRLRYDPGAVQVTSVVASEQTDRLNRLFHADLPQASGDLLLGLSDTRRVRLPARATLFVLTLAKATPGARLRLVDGIGVRDGSGKPEAIKIAEAALELAR